MINWLQGTAGVYMRSTASLWLFLVSDVISLSCISKCSYVDFWNCIELNYYDLSSTVIEHASFVETLWQWETMLKAQFILGNRKKQRSGWGRHSRAGYPCNRWITKERLSNDEWETKIWLWGWFWGQLWYISSPEFAPISEFAPMLSFTWPEFSPHLNLDKFLALICISMIYWLLFTFRYIPGSYSY